MSWMDSWSRPSKSQAVPAPYYLSSPNAPYCQTCGRIIGARRVKASAKYCSEKCKHRRKADAKLEARIEEALGVLLGGGCVVFRPEGDVEGEGEGEEGGRREKGEGKEEVVKAEQQGRKGDPRVIVRLSELERAVFGDRRDPEKTFGRRKNRRARGVAQKGEWQSVDMEDPGPDNGADSESDSSIDNGSVNGVSVNDHIRAPQGQSDVNFSVGGERGWGEKIEETSEMVARRREGQRRAEEREVVRNVVRRAVVFGLLVESVVEKGGKKGKKGRRREDDEGEEANGDGRVTRKCEALMNGGQVVEPSFAKGDWEVRFRED